MARTPAWSAISSSRRCSTSPATPARRWQAPADRAGWARWPGPRREGDPHRRARHPGGRRRSARASSSTPGRSMVSSARAASRPSWVGARMRGAAGGWPPARVRLRGGDLPDAAGRRHARPHLDAAGRPLPRLPHHPQRGISIADYYTVRTAAQSPTGRPRTTPTTPATTRCCRCTSWPGRTAAAGEAAADDGRDHPRHRRARRAADGPRKGAYWYGSRLTIEQARGSCRTTTPPSAGDGGGAGRVIWAMENPRRGLVEADELDHRAFWRSARPYLGEVVGVYTDWTPLHDRGRSSRRTSTSPTPGSSRTCASPSGRAAGGQRRFLSLTLPGLPFRPSPPGG